MSIKVKVTDWHYRLIRKLDRWPENNLCPYCRQVVYALLTVAGYTVLISVLGSGAIAGYTFPVWQFFWDGPLVIAPLAFVLYLVTGIVSIVAYRDHRRWLSMYQKENSIWHYDLFTNIKRWYWKSATAKAEARVEKGPNLLTQYITAKHDKICPHIDFMEETSKKSRL
jgi:hypothetical protein